MWSPEIQYTGRYNVYIRWTADTNRPTNAPLSYTFGDNTGTIYLNQTKNNGTWVLLGTFELASDGINYLKLFATSNGYTIADAVKLELAIGFFKDVGVIFNGSNQLPSIIAVNDTTLTVVAQNRYPTTVSGGNVEKGPADILSFTSTDKGDSWSNAHYIFSKDEALDGNVDGYSSILVMDGGILTCVYSVGPENWSTS